MEIPTPQPDESKSINMTDVWTIVISLDTTRTSISSMPPPKTKFATKHAKQSTAHPSQTYNYVLGSNNTTFTHTRDVSTAQGASRKRRMILEEEDEDEDVLGMF
jgi:hypothetical protein